MRNLKKILALVLALAMAFSLVASAASFPDVEPTSATGQAVDLLTGLNIVGGYPDGTFGPKKEITRAEFLKMLFITLNGKDDDGLFGGNSDKFPDVTGDKWFAPYVNWGVQLGIIGGYPDGTFKPDNNVTVAEAAKMIVTALGFDALDFSFPYGFIDKGIQLGIFANVSGIGADDSALRGNIAIMNYNMLFVTSAPRYGTYIPNTGWVYVTPIEKVFGAQKVTSEVVATSTNMPGLADIVEDGKVALKANNDSENGTQIMSGNYDFAGVDAMLGHTVEVWFINAKGDKGVVMGDKKEDKIVAITDAVDQSIVVAASALTTSSAGTGDIKNGDAYATIDGVDTMLFAAMRDLNGNPKKDSNGDVLRHFWNEDGANKYKNWVLNGGAADPEFQVYPRSYNQNSVVFTASISGAYTFVDNDLTTNDRTENAWDHVYVNYWRTGKVTNVTSANITIDGINRNSAIPLKQIKGDISSLVKGDYVNVSVTTGIVDKEIKDIYTIEKAEVLKDVVIEARTNRGLRIDGNLYLYSFFNGFADAAATHNSVVVGESYDVVLDKGGYIYFYETPEVLPNFMIITNVSSENKGIMGNEYTVSGMLSDGTVTDLKLADSLKKITLGSDVIFDTSVDERIGWTDTTGAAAASKTSINAIGKLVKYTTDADGKIDSMTALDRAVEIQPTETFKYDAEKKLVYKRTDNGAPVVDKTVADNTVFFLYDNNDTTDNYMDDKFEVKTGADMTSFDNTKVALLTTQEENVSVVEAMLITSDLGAVNGYNTVMAYGTYDKGMVTNPENRNEKGFEFKLFVNGQAKTFRTAYYDVTSANGVLSAEYDIINRQVLGISRTSLPNVNGLVYVEFDADGNVAHLYGPATANRNIKTLAANVTTNTTAGSNNFYRAAVIDVNTTANTVTFGMVGTSNRGSKAEFVGFTSDGATVTENWAYYYDTFATIPVAKDVAIQVIDGTPSTYANSTISVGSLSDLIESSDAGYSYIADFVLAHENNNVAEPLEITQLTFFKFAVGNTWSDTKPADENVVLTSFMGHELDNNGALPAGTEIKVDANVASITDEMAQAKTLVNGATATVTSGALTAGQKNNVVVKVTAKDGKTTKNYTFEVYRAKELATGTVNVTLSAKALNAGAQNINLADIYAQLDMDEMYDNTRTYTLVKGQETVTGSTSSATAKATRPNSATITLTKESGEFQAGDTFTVKINIFYNGNNAALGQIQQDVTVTLEA